MIFAADIMSLRRSQTEVFGQTFVHKSLWGYGGKAPVTIKQYDPKSIEAGSISVAVAR